MKLPSITASGLLLAATLLGLTGCASLGSVSVTQVPLFGSKRCNPLRPCATHTCPDLSTANPDTGSVG